MQAPYKILAFVRMWLWAGAISFLPSSVEMGLDSGFLKMSVLIFKKNKIHPCWNGSLEYREKVSKIIRLRHAFLVNSGFMKVHYESKCRNILNQCQKTLSSNTMYSVTMVTTWNNRFFISFLTWNIEVLKLYFSTNSVYYSIESNLLYRAGDLNSPMFVILKNSFYGHLCVRKRRDIVVSIVTGSSLTVHWSSVSIWKESSDIWRHP